MKNTRWMTVRGLSAALAVFFISSHAFSNSQIVSEFELSLPRHFLQNLIEKKWESLMNKEFQGNWPFSDQTVISQDVPVLIKNINLKVNTRLKKPSLGSAQNTLILTSENLQSELTLGEVSVDQVIERNVGGVIGRFRVQAVCQNVLLRLTNGQGRFSVALKPEVSATQLGLKVEDVALTWNLGAWQVESMSCQGVSGFEALLREAVVGIAKDAQSFVAPRKEMIKNYVQANLNDVGLDFSETRKLSGLRPDIQGHIKVVKNTDLGAQGLQVRGLVVLDFTNDNSGVIKNLTLQNKPAADAGSEAQLQLPETFVAEFMRSAYSANSWLHKLSSNQIPGFSSLMKSRFSQFFVWPELMKYSKSSQFWFDLYSNKNITLQGSGLTYQMQVNFLAKMKAPKSGGYVPFMNFNLPLNTQLSLNVSQGVLSMNFVNPSLGLTPQWDPSYIQNYDPSRRFSAGTIRDRIQSSLEGKTVTLQLPEIPLSEGLSLKISKMRGVRGQDLTVLLRP